MRVVDPHQELQSRLLPGVSRTFALTIPLLPHSLRFDVTNAYLLCRIADTIEDELQIPANEKVPVFMELACAVRGEGNPTLFTKSVLEKVSPASPTTTRELCNTFLRLLKLTTPCPMKGANPL